MDKVRFVVLYGGEWSNNGGKFKYQFGMCKVISVSRETTYQSLHDIISRLVEANPSESSIKMKFIFTSPDVLAPFEVLNDDDVQVFLCENSDVNTSLCGYCCCFYAPLNANVFICCVMQVLCKIFHTILYAPIYGSNWLLL